MYEILKTLAFNNGWDLTFGRHDFQNLHDGTEKTETSYIFLDPVEIADNDNESGVTESKTFSGSFMILYSSDIDELSYEERYEKYIKPIVLGDFDLIKKELQCNYQVKFDLWKSIPVINILDYNFDGIICTFQITIEDYVLAEQFTLSIEIDGDGQTSPKAGNYLIDEGAEVNLIAAENIGNEFVEWDFGETQSEERNQSFIMSGLVKAVARFKLLYQTVQDVFSTAPIKSGDDWVWMDSSEYGNNVKALKSQVGYFSYTNNSQIITSNFITGQTAIGLEVNFNYKYSGTSKYLFGTKATSASSKGILINITASNVLQILISNGSTQQAINVATISQNTEYSLALNWDGLTGGTITLLVNGTTYTYTASQSWSGNAQVRISYSLGGTYYGRIHSVKLSGVFEFVFNHGQGTVLYDISGNGNNANITTTDVDEFWSLTLDNEPYVFTLGATLYKHNTNDSILPICFDTSQAITGFTRIGYFPPGSGALKGLPNTYYITGIDDIIPEGEYTIEELITYESDNCIITQDDNVVSRMVCKGVDEYTGEFIGTEEGDLTVEEDNDNNLIIPE